MKLNTVKIVRVLLILLIGSGCGLGNPSGGHDPNLPLPVVVSNKTSVWVDHTRGAIITTPDGMAMLSISQTALSADTRFTIVPYDLGTSDGPIFRAGPMVSFLPVTVPALIPGQFITVTLFYDPSLFPAHDSRLISSTGSVTEQDARLARFQDDVDYTKRCWQKVFLDAPSIVPGQMLHQISTHDITTLDVTQLGVFGITSIFSYVCPYNFLQPPH